MLPGARSQHGQLYVTGGVPLTTDPRLSGFALKPTGEVYASISGNNVWSPAELFMEGEEGGWFDPSDLSTMFQDSAGTTPVTADGQPVGLILDKSGNGNHASQPTAAARPLYKTDGTHHWLQFDGVDDALSTAAINFTSTDKMSVFCGVHKASSTLWQQLYEFSPNSDNNPGTFACNAPGGSVDGYSFYAKGATGQGGAIVVSGYVPPVTSVLSSLLDLSGASMAAALITRIDGILKSPTLGGTLPGGGNYGNFPLYLGARSGVSARFTGNIYSLIVVGKQCTQEEIDRTETWVNGKTGAY